MDEVKPKVRKFILENFLFGDDNGLRETTSFLDEGIVDSMGILELVEFLKEEFCVHVEDEELLPENLDSINNVAMFVQRKLGASTTASTNVQYCNA